jgi:hypothetical protein
VTVVVVMVVIVVSVVTVVVVVVVSRGSNPLKVKRRFGGTYCLHIEHRRINRVCHFHAGSVLS